MAKQPTSPQAWTFAPTNPPTNPCNFFITCPFHNGANSQPLEHPCRSTLLGTPIHLGDVELLRWLLHHEASPNHPCHMGMGSRPEAVEVKFPLDLVTSRDYHHHSDECFLALVAGGADPRLQAQTEEERRNLNDCMMIFALRPNAELRTLDVVLKLGVANTEWGRDRLVNAVTQRCWYVLTKPGTRREVWTRQDDSLLAERQRLILEHVSLTEAQKAKFWCDG